MASSAKELAIGVLGSRLRVSRILFRHLRGGAVISLHSTLPPNSLRPTRAVFVVPGQDSARIWPCCGWGLPCHGCRHPRGALLPHHFTLTWAVGSRQSAVGSEDGDSVLLLTAHCRLPTTPAVYFLWHFPSDSPGLPRTSPPRRYRASCPVQFGLSSPACASATATATATLIHHSGECGTETQRARRIEVGGTADERR